LSDDYVWHKIAELDELPEGRVKTVTAGRTSLALTHFDGRYGALDNHCPHQGGPLGEGSIEKSWLRCPWHGYDYDPISGTPPPGFRDAPRAYECEARADGVYVALPPETARVRTISDLMVDTMCAWGVSHVFGMVGHSNLGFADAMRVAEERGDLQFIGIRHEGAAAFAASAYGKLTGRIGACFAIAGPGSTNLLTGLYDAKVDRAPVLAISGQVPSNVRGRGAFQDLDLSAAFADVSVSTQTVHRDSDHVELMNLACKHALVQRGVAHLVLPDEVQVLPAPESGRPGSPEGRLPSGAVVPADASIELARPLVTSARRPVIVVGHGARAGIDEVVRLAEHLNAPILTTFKAKGIVPDDHPLAAGVLGRSGTPVASWLMNESDLLLVFGASFANHTGIASYKPIIQVDHDPEALGRFHSVTVAVLGDIGVAVSRLSFADAQPVDQRPDVAERKVIWNAEKERRRHDDRGRGIASAALFEALSRHVPEDAVIAVDVGNNTYSFGRYFECKRGQHVLMSGYLGSIGFGFPAAMGAWAAAPDRPIVAVTGDGGFGQYLAETTTAVRYGMNITHVVLNNAQLGKITKEQRAAEWDVWQTALQNPEFAAYAQLCGALGERVTTPNALDGAFERGFAHNGTALVEVMTDADLV
jgi:thiamine pyrophosphate-dependent acetolactate synthase large subunit-like protein/nitrite reductase/ring-hydroxylating ferredoxin subunit